MKVIFGVVKGMEVEIDCYRLIVGILRMYLMYIFDVFFGRRVFDIIVNDDYKIYNKTVIRYIEENSKVRWNI